MRARRAQAWPAVGAAALAAACATGGRTGGEAQSAHARSGVRNTAPVAERGDAGDGDRALDATPRLERRHDGGETPALDRLPECGLAALPPGLRCRHGADVRLHDQLRRRRGTDHVRQPAPRRGPPGGTARIPALLSPQDGLPAGRGGLAIPDGILPGAAAGADRLGLDCRAIDSRQLAGAPESGPLGRLASIGVDAVAGLLRDPSRGHDPAEPCFLGAIARQPGPAGSSGVDQDQLWRLRGACAEALVTVALARPETPHEDDLCRPRIADRGHGDGGLVHIPTDEECGRVRPG